MNYKLTIFPILQDKNICQIFLYETAEQMISSSDAIKRHTIFLQEQAQLMLNYPNLFMLEEKVNGEWVEYEEF